MRRRRPWRDFLTILDELLLLLLKYRSPAMTTATFNRRKAPGFRGLT